MFTSTLIFTSKLQFVKYSKSKVIDIQLPIEIFPDDKNYETVDRVAWYLSVHVCTTVCGV